MTLQQHPLSAAFPAMPEDDIESLAQDIRKNGQREPGIGLDGMVLDGWHRYLACEKAGIKFRLEEFDGTDPVGFVLSKNLHRRHLTASQRAAAIVSATNWRPVGRSSNRAPGARLPTNGEMAHAAEVSERTIKQAKAAHEAGLGDAVREGKVSAKRASEVAKLPKGKQAKALGESSPKKDDPRDAELKRLKLLVAEKDEHIDNLSETARELQDKLTAFEKTEPDEQQREIMKLQKALQKMEGEISRVTRQRNDCQAKCNELIREVKRLRKRG